MTLYEQWKDLVENQTDDTFPVFWDEYSEAEKRIYTGLLQTKETPVQGIFRDLAAANETSAVLYMGFLDGVNESLREPLDLAGVTEESELSFTVDYEALFYNMLRAKADHLFTLEAWDDVLPDETRQAIADTWRRSRTVVKEKAPGRNDPCPCGSGKKYKKCCGAI